MSGSLFHPHPPASSHCREPSCDVSRAALIDSGRTLERHCFVAEDLPLVAEQLSFLLGHVPTGGKQVHDENIVATLIACDVRTLLAYNLGDFKRFSSFVDIAEYI
jgi:hypothetical protein